MNDSLIKIIDSLKYISETKNKDTLYVMSINSNKDFIDIFPIIIASIALVLSFIATYISKKNLDENKLHQRLSVIPALNYFVDFTLRPNCEGVGLLIKNVGLGPALIKEFILSWGDINIFSQDDFSKIPPQVFYGAFEGSYFTPNSIIDKSEVKWILRIPLNYLLLPDGAVDMEKVKNIEQKIKKNLRLKIIYRSFYDEKKFEFEFCFN
ncbi:MAG: hypothetical protein AB1521_16125 [Bacteroidota bacterium]